MERRLAAILSADVVGYSRLMGDDEAGTLVDLRGHRQNTIEPTVASYRGRVVDFVGDNFLAEFASVVDAVACAVAVQRELADRNSKIPEHRRIYFRMGVNLGDVIAENDRLYGDGVNVAARLEALSDPGGVFLSRAAYDQVHDKLDLAFEDLDEIEVKNIARPIRVYRVAPDGHLLPPGPEPARPKSRRRTVIVACAVLFIVAAGVPWWQWRSALQLSAVSDEGQTVHDNGAGGETTRKRAAVDPDAVRTAMEVTYWNSVKDTGDVSLVWSYVERFPDGQFVSVARTELENIEARATAAKAEAERRRIAEQQASAELRRKTQLAAEQRRLAEARERRKQAELAAMRTRQENELADWEEVRNSDSVEAVEAFLDEYPNGAFADLARAKRHALEQQRQAALQAEAEDASVRPLYELGLTLRIQQNLARLGCLDRKPDGKWGDDSRKAEGEFLRRSNAQLAQSGPSSDLLNALEKHTSRVCP